MKLLLFFFAFYQSACLKQYDPTPHWEKARSEEKTANRLQATLTDDYQIPSSDEGPVLSQVDKKYQSLCAGCHGAAGQGDGPLAANIKDAVVRNFVTWNDPAITDEYIAKIIREGGVAVGKSAQMAAWGGALSEDLINQMVGKVRSFAATQ